MELTHLAILASLPSAAVVVGCSLRWRTQQAMRAEEARLALLPEPVALSPDVEDVAVVEQPVKDG